MKKAMAFQSSFDWPIRVTWICCTMPSVAAVLLGLLAVHGWILGPSAGISENVGPFWFVLHYGLMGVWVLAATWLAGPLWILVVLMFGRQITPEARVGQLFLFMGGWLLIFGAAVLVEQSPAGKVF